MCVHESEVRGVKWSLNRISNESFNKIKLVKLNVDHIPYLPINVVIYLSRSGDVLSQYFSSRWPQCITSQPLLVNTVVGQY